MIPPYKKWFWGLLAVSTIIRAVLAALLDLGNDEVYYWTYALYPDWSHFDHPPMVGWFIQLFSLNLFFQQEFFLRLASVITTTVNTWIVFEMTAWLCNKRTAWIASLLYTASIYVFIINGIFILPDTPQNLFWITALFLSLKVFPGAPAQNHSLRNLALIGVLIGLAMLSKYTSVFLWLGIGLYVVVYKAVWLRSLNFYIAILISLIIFIPVIYWNTKYDFISFTFQSGRVGIFERGLNPASFFQEVLGQVFYNNPFNLIWMIMGLVMIAKGNSSICSGPLRILLLAAIPLILVFLFFSMFRSTLPHWTGPAYTSLIIPAACWVDVNFKRKKLFPLPVVLSLSALLIILIVGLGQIFGGWISFSEEKPIERRYKDDLSLDLYGWKDLSHQFSELYWLDRTNNVSDESTVIISDKWFPMANLDYYVARPLGIKVLGLGSLDQIHKYYWINQIRGGLDEVDHAYYITTNRDFRDPAVVYRNYFETIVPTDTLVIRRNQKPVKWAFVYHLYGIRSDSLGSFDPFYDND